MAAKDPSDNAISSRNGLQSEEPVARTENGATRASTSESVRGSEKARSKGGAHSRHSSRSARVVVVQRPPRSGGFMAKFPILALTLTWGMWTLDRMERSRDRRTKEAVDDKLKEFVHEREALDTIMKDVAVIKENAKKKGGLWAIFQRR